MQVIHGHELRDSRHQMDAFGIVMKIPTSSSGYPLPPSPVRAWSSSDPTMAKNGLVLSSPSTPSTRPLSLSFCPCCLVRICIQRASPIALARSLLRSLASAANLVKAFGRSRSRSSGAAAEEDGERVSGIITLRMQGGPHVLCHDLRSGPWIRCLF